MRDKIAILKYFKGVYMYNLSEKTKNNIIKQCFEDVCISAQKEETGALKVIMNSVAKPSLFFDEENNVVVTEKDRNLSINYIYKFSDSKRRIQIIAKLDEPYIFEVELNGEKLTLECDQYSCKCFD